MVLRGNTVIGMVLLASTEYQKCFIGLEKYYAVIAAAQARRAERKLQKKAFTGTVKPSATWKHRILKYRAPRDVRLKIAMIREKDLRKSKMMAAKELRQKSAKEPCIYSEEMQPQRNSAV